MELFASVEEPGYIIDCDNIISVAMVLTGFKQALNGNNLCFVSTQRATQLYTAGLGFMRRGYTAQHGPQDGNDRYLRRLQLHIPSGNHLQWAEISRMELVDFYRRGEVEALSCRTRLQIW